MQPLPPVANFGHGKRKFVGNLRKGAFSKKKEAVNQCVQGTSVCRCSTFKRAPGSRKWYSLSWILSIVRQYYICFPKSSVNQVAIVKLCEQYKDLTWSTWILDKPGRAETMVCWKSDGFVWLILLVFVWSNWLNFYKFKKACRNS